MLQIRQNLNSHEEKLNTYSINRGIVDFGANFIAKVDAKKNDTFPKFALMFIFYLWYIERSCQ
jgi:hypothetical protein